VVKSLKVAQTTNVIPEGLDQVKEIPEVVPAVGLIGFLSVGTIGVLVQPIQNGADKVGFSFSTLMCLSLNFQKNFPLKKYEFPSFHLKTESMFMGTPRHTSNMLFG